MVDIAEQIRQKYRPDSSLETRERFDDFFKNYWPKTNFETDVILVSNDEGKPIAFGVFLKTQNSENPWSLSYNVYPRYDSVDVAKLVIPEMLQIAKEKNAPKLITAHRNTQMELREVILSLNFEEENYSYALRTKNLDGLPKITIPKGILIKKSNTIKDPIQYVNLFNEVYNDRADYVPNSPETIKEWEIMEKTRFEIIYYSAFKGDALVGVCTVLDNLDETKNRRIDDIGVYKNFRDKGVGSALMNKALHDLCQKGRKKVDFYTSGKNKSVIRLPLKFGFEIDNTNSSIRYKYKIKKNNSRKRI